MATRTITLLGNSSNIQVGAFQDIDQDDIFDDPIIQKVTRGLFTNNAPSLTTFFTSSAQSASSGQYYYDVYDKAGSDSTREVQFAVAYGHALGSGSIVINAASNFAGAQDTPSRAIYAQYVQTLLPSTQQKFSFTGVGDENIIYVINFKRGRIKDLVDPGNFELNLRSGSNQLQLIDDSRDTLQAGNQNSEFFNIVSGSLSAGIVVPSTTRTYGRVYPERGVIVLSGTLLASSSIPVLNTNTGSNVNGNNAFKLFEAISSSAAADPTNGVFKGRNVEEVKSTYYFLRAKNKDFNFSNNPSYVSASGGINVLRQPTFVNNPKSYITTVGLYNSGSEMLAVGKLSKPILKSFGNEILLKVKLDF